MNESETKRGKSCRFLCFQPALSLEGGCRGVPITKAMLQSPRGVRTTELEDPGTEQTPTLSHAQHPRRSSQKVSFHHIRTWSDAMTHCVESINTSTYSPMLFGTMSQRSATQLFAQLKDKLTKAIFKLCYSLFSPSTNLILKKKENLMVVKTSIISQLL